MNPAPGTSWPDLHYVEAEQVELDMCAIIARGTRLRRKRRITKIAAAALVMGVAPAVVIADMAAPVVFSGPEAVPIGTAARQPNVHSATVRGTSGSAGSAAAGGYVPAVFGTNTNGQVHRALAGPNGTAGDEVMYSLARAVVRPAAKLPHRYGSLLAVAGARAGTGLWFTATAAQLTLFHLSMAGAMKSWSLPTPARTVRASAGVGLAVTAAGVAWIGVGSTLLSLDTRTSRLRTWQMPVQDSLIGTSLAEGTAAAGSPADSVAISPDGHVAVVTPQSNSVRVLDPGGGAFQEVKLPDAADRALALGYTRGGALGIGYQQQGKPHSGAVLLVNRAGAQQSTPVPQPTAIAPYGASGLLVGVTKLDVVSARGHLRPLALPAASPDVSSVTTPPVPLPGDRLGIAANNLILTFPATVTSNAIIAGQSELWVTPPPRCQPHSGCPAGYRLLATDAAGDVWAVPKADPRTVELVSLR